MIEGQRGQIHGVNVRRERFKTRRVGTPRRRGHTQLTCRLLRCIMMGDSRVRLYLRGTVWMNPLDREARLKPAGIRDAGCPMTTS